MATVFVAVGVGSIFSQQQPTATAAASGTIQGTVTYVADPQHPWRLGRYYIANARTGELAEAVVAIAARGLALADDQREIRTATVDQKDFQFSPETLAIRAGDRVRFVNSDNQTHNVKTSHPKHSFNVTMPAASEHFETFASAAGINQPFRIDCVFHSAMRAWIFVFDHPWFQLTDKDGSFRMEKVPPGEYRLDVVHAAGDLRARQTVRVEAGKTSQIRVVLTAVDSNS